MLLRPFTRSDWYAFGGAERPSEFVEPRIGVADSETTGIQAIVVADKNGLRVMYQDDDGSGHEWWYLEGTFQLARVVAAALVEPVTRQQLRDLGFTGNYEPTGQEERM